MTGAVEKTDDALVKETLRGRLGAFDELMLKYQKLVCKVAMNYVREKQNALDVTQDVFLKVYKHLDRVTAKGMFKPWLLRITYNESINWLRKSKPHEELDELADYNPAVGEAPEQEAVVLDKENRSLLLRGLEKLNRKYKLSVSLRYAEGMRIKEIADVMDCSEGMVKSLLFRGVRQIRDRVARSA